MERLDLLQAIIMEGHRENRADHDRIELKLERMEDKISSLRVKVASIAAVVGLVSSSLTTLAAHFWGN
jgi:hypothetical protein